MGWTERVIAQCYYHSPLPALVRPIRDRYQLTASPESGKRRRLTRRSEPSARILYYHRVNDENNPFFPAISTTLFDREMSFLHKYYTVVSLADLLRRLADGSGKPVVAVTFDDGYQDNYHNAFPVLERYRIPATIFLTTGSMDSREPLWFERLSGGFQKTTREFLDLEAGTGERLPLRTVAQKLKANDRTFSILRGLPDEERQRWLRKILEKLAVSGSTGLNDRMLTWDQVRAMQSRGVDFGGHTVTHPFLSRTTTEQFRWEITECKKRIEQELQRPVHHLAYPNGREEDFGAANKDLVREAHYTAAVTTLWGTNYASTDPMELRRGGPWEQSAPQFAYKLDWYQLAND